MLLLILLIALIVMSVGGGAGYQGGTYRRHGIGCGGDFPNHGVNPPLVTTNALTMRLITGRVAMSYQATTGAASR
jgi:hypothetical protein